MLKMAINLLVLDLILLLHCVESMSEWDVLRHLCIRDHTIILLLHPDKQKTIKYIPIKR
jgi:hypothetical protein